MFKYLKNIILLLPLCLLVACGESDTPQEKVTTTPVEDSAPAVVEEVAKTVTETVATSETQQAETGSTIEKTVAEIKEQVEEVSEVVSTDKPYQLVDGVISANAVEGWKTYNGGGCGACHGKGAIGAVGPNLGQSVTQKLSKEEFIDTVANGRPGTMMRPHKTNTRVMENLDNLYAYLVARGDGVLGPGNLIKMPLGK